MRIVSLVPSWTETLIAAGAEVVGRTRFCIHPADRVPAIPAIGGTKDIDWKAVTALKPDLLLLDREENLRRFSEESAFPVHTTHIQGIADLEPELRALAEKTGLAKLGEFADRWREVAANPHPACRAGASPAELPGILETWRAPGRKCGKIVYIIWKNPWMAAGRATFVGSMLTHFGWGEAILPSTTEKYPQLDFASLDPERSFLLFSSEPFPFARYKEEVLALGFAAGLIDGEAYSWFGLRSLEFLERNRPIF